MTNLYRSASHDESTRRTTTQLMAVCIETDTPTLPPPPKACTCCGESVTHEEWMTNATRRSWPGLGLEIQEHSCRSTLAAPVNALAPVVR